MPLAPAGFEFPKVDEGQEVLFIGQIHIADFNQWQKSTRELNGEGIIYMFGTIIKEYDSYRLNDILLRYSDQTHDLLAIDLPEGSREFGIFPERDMMIYEEINIPDQGTSTFDLEDMDANDANIYSELEDLIKNYDVRKSFKFLGLPSPVQHCTLFEAEMKQQNLLFYSKAEYTNEMFMETYLRLRECSQDWRLLLELDMMLFPQLEKHEGSFNSGMDGVFFVMLRQKELDEIRVEKAITIYQST